MWIKEVALFIGKNLWAAFFGVSLLIIISLSSFWPADFWLTRYDAIFLSAVGIQILLVTTKMESWQEVKIIAVFHVAGTVMELIKTNPQIGSWSYPEVNSAIFSVATVPLFTGFLYASVGSYIARSIRIFDVQFSYFPKKIFLGILAIAIYINFFSHHFFYDIRYILLTIILILFWKTRIIFTVCEKKRNISFLLANFFLASAIWIAENIGSFAQVWMYPNQEIAWELVSYQKIESWFLLLFLSFFLVSLVHVNAKCKN